MTPSRLLSAALATITLVGAAQARQAPPRQPTAPGEIVAQINAEAEAVKPLITTEAAQAWLDAAQRLPAIEPRVLHYNRAAGATITAEEFAKLPEAEKANYTETPLDERYYYLTRYGTPIAYARALDLAVQAVDRPARDQFAEWRILDYGYGAVGHLRMLASLGADVVGVEVDPILNTLYSDPADTGDIENPNSRRRDSAGHLKLVHGRWPAEPDTVEAVGRGFDLIISKNVLKRGYIHPEQEVDKRMLVDMGVDDAGFLQALYDALNPGGRVLIYNISPAPSPEGQPYKPWADGRCPFDRAAIEAAGLRIVELDKDDSETVRDMASRLGWDKGERPMDLQNDLFAHYTILERPLRSRGN